tara:strand:+ start:160 stop:621 length:462 start_codon:yes stop_codon:yes gene_type:complete
MKNIWVTASNEEEKPWGKETAWSTSGGGHISGKILYLKKDCRNSLKYSLIKEETLHIMSGELLLTFSDEKFKEHEMWKSRICKPGDTIHVQSGCPYRIKALEDSTIIEIGSRIHNTATVRFHDDYGRHSSTDEFKVYQQAELVEKSMMPDKDN